MPSSRPRPRPMQFAALVIALSSSSPSSLSRAFLHHRRHVRSDPKGLGRRGAGTCSPHPSRSYFAPPASATSLLLAKKKTNGAPSPREEEDLDELLSSLNVKRRKKKKVKINGSGDDDDGDGGGTKERLCIGFSRTFQRHVAYRPRRGTRSGGISGGGPSAPSPSSNSTSSSSSDALCCRFDDNCDQVVASFEFLDEATAAYPSASLVRIDAVVSERDDDDPHSVLAGMGTVPTRRVARIVLMDDDDDGVAKDGMEKKGEGRRDLDPSGEHRVGDGDGRGDDDDEQDVRYVRSAAHRSSLDRRSRSALRYLSSLTASLASQSIRDPKELKGMEDRVSAVLERRVGLRRFMSHDLGSIRRNYVRISDLLTRGREHKVAPSSFPPKRGGGRPMGATEEDSNEEDTEEAVAVESLLEADGGLAFTERAVHNLVSSFPEICLYEYREVEERVRFLTAPLPPPESVGGALYVDDEAAGSSQAAAAIRKGADMGRKRRGRRPETEVPGEGTGKGKRKRARTKGGDDGIDWPRLSWEGYGAGLTIEQATVAVRAVPNILALHHTDAQKPPTFYFYRDLGVDPRLCREVEQHLGRYLVGSDPSDVAALSFLRGLGVGWASLRALVGAFPALTACDAEPGWELLNEGPVRQTLNEGATVHLRKRLQIGTGEVFHMMKTHSRMTMYSTTKNMAKLDALQSRVGLSSRQLRAVLLRMPSLLGMGVDDAEDGSPSALQSRLDFFLSEAGLKKDELAAAIIKQPSLLQYGVNSTLRPKMKFLTDELGIPQSVVSRIIVTAPAFMGLSLSENLRPTAGTLVEFCGLSPEQVGEVVATVPQILCLSVKRKIEPCLSFLADALRLSSKQELGDIVMKAPRVLIQSIDSSLARKMHMIKNEVEEENKRIGAKVDINSLAALLVVQNPAVLVTTNPVLAKRLKACRDAPDISLSSALEPKSTGRKRKFSFAPDSGTKSNRIIPDGAEVSRKIKTVLELSPDSDRVLNAFACVKEAARSLNVSDARVYSACKQEGKLLKGRRFAYADVDQLTSSADKTDGALWNQGSKMIVIEPLRIFDGSASPAGNVSIVCFTSGQVFPSDSDSEVRGTYQTGGMAAYFPQALSGRRNLVTPLKVAAESSWGLIIPENEGGYSFNSGCIMADFTPLNPSRNRCELCACELALKVIRNLLKQAASTTDLTQSDVQINVYTSSFYAWRLLRDSERLMRWGASPSAQEFVYDGKGPAALANPDLLYPIADIVRELRVNVAIGKSVEISFHHSADAFPGRTYEGFARRIDDYAKRAAIWSFERKRTVVY